MLNQLNPPRAAHVATERESRVAVHHRRLGAQVGAVEGDLEPGDQILAETLGEAGRVPWWEGPALYAAYAIAACGILAAAVLFIAGKHAQASVVWVCSAPYYLVSRVAPRRTPTYIVVTTSRVYLIPLATGRRGRARAITRTPVGCVRVTRERAGRFRRVIQLEGPAFPVTGVQFLVTGAWRADLDGVLSGIRSGGDALNTASPAAASRDPQW